MKIMRYNRELSPAEVQELISNLALFARIDAKNYEGMLQLPLIEQLRQLEDMEQLCVDWDN